jgi:hypothetical protein
MNAISTSSRYVDAECAELRERLRALEYERRDLESVIQSHRQQNQVAGYFGALLIVPALAAEHDTNEKARLDEIQRQEDELRAVGARKDCLGAPSLRR